MERIPHSFSRGTRPRRVGARLDWARGWAKVSVIFRVRIVATRTNFAHRAALRIARAPVGHWIWKKIDAVRDVRFVFLVAEVVPSWAREAERDSPGERTEEMNDRRGTGVDHAWTSSGPLPNIGEFYDALLVIAGGCVQDTSLNPSIR